MPYSASASRQSLLAYCLPRSLWKITPACLLGWRLNHAMRSASMTMSRVRSKRRLQPITWRLNRSITTARNNPPSSVAMYLMSPARTLSGSLTVNSRLSRLGAIGRS